MSMTATGGPLSIRPCAATLDAILAVRPTPPREISFNIAPLGEPAGRGFLERFAAARQTWVGHEILVRIERLLAGCRFHTQRRAVRQEHPALLVILEIGNHDLIKHLLMHRRVDDRAQRLDATIEVAGHQIRRGNIDRRLGMRQTVSAAETIDAPMLEEAADDRLDANVLRKAGNAGPQATNAAYDQVDRYPRGGRLIERIDHDRVDQRIHLHPDRGRPARLGMSTLRRDM